LSWRKHPLAEGLEFESEFVLVVVVCEGLECLLVVEEMLEHPQLAKLEGGDPFTGSL
jgi:hypothetical protein